MRKSSLIMEDVTGVEIGTPTDPVGPNSGEVVALACELLTWTQPQQNISGQRITDAKDQT